MDGPVVTKPRDERTRIERPLVFVRIGPNMNEHELEKIVNYRTRTNSNTRVFFIPEPSCIELMWDQADFVSEVSGQTWGPFNAEWAVSVKNGRSCDSHVVSFMMRPAILIIRKLTVLSHSIHLEPLFDVLLRWNHGIVVQFVDHHIFSIRHFWIQKSQLCGIHLDIHR